jgi:hypothetical protein
MRRAVLALATLVAAAAPAAADVLNGGFESGTGSVPANWSAINGSLDFASNGQRLTSLSGISPPTGSYMAYADTSPTGQDARSGLISTITVVDGASVQFVADFLTNETAGGSFDDIFSVILVSGGAGAPANVEVTLGTVNGSTFIGSGGGFSSHTGFQTFQIDLGDRVGFVTTFQFNVRDVAGGSGTSAFLLDDVMIVPEPGAMALFALGALGFGALAWRRRKRTSSPRRA